MQLLKLLVKATGKKGLQQGGVLSPVLSNWYLNEVDRMLERAQETTAGEPTLTWSMHGSPMTAWFWWMPTGGMTGCSKL